MGGISDAAAAMRKSRLFLLLLLPALLPAAASAEGSDAAYCAALSDQAQRYLVSCAIDGDNKPDLETRTAIDACNQGRTAVGIAVLERKLRTSGFTLPQR
ncbi:hypothetical protein [Enhydrobacter sp.]|uniref:hypothetical protein n=1 Tax=Enhydrobacter sp. TaxID=1894999 RepID=UPI002618A2DC|nr:hypothetical protein [Enhydrobacter sp.]WIM09218.1 MAG: hypothetical protein OJF58_000169 [Enhydrobacter sp.]